MRVNAMTPPVHPSPLPTYPRQSPAALCRQAQRGVISACGSASQHQSIRQWAVAWGARCTQHRSECYHGSLPSCKTKCCPDRNIARRYSSPTCLTGSRDDWSYLEGSPWDGSGLFLPPDGWTWKRRCAAFPKACGHTRASIRPFCIFCERIIENQNPMPTLHLRCLAQLMRPAASDLSSACLGSFVFVFW